MRWFDTHAHLQDEKFAEDLPQVIARAQKAGVQHVLLPGDSVASVVRGAEMTAQNPAFFSYSVGVHPHLAKTVDDDGLQALTELMAKERIKPVAIGEVGLDYHYDLSPRPRQQAVFQYFIQLAWEQDLPLIIHNREATEDGLNILKKMSASGRLPSNPGVFHCFSGSLETAKILLDMGFHLGFDGPITFKNARKAIEVLAYCPLDRILLETDSPFLSPEPLRGKRNEPANLTYIGQKVAEIKKMRTEEIAAATWENAAKLFAPKI